MPSKKQSKVLKLEAYRDDVFVCFMNQLHNNWILQGTCWQNLPPTMQQLQLELLVTVKAQGHKTFQANATHIHLDFYT